MFLYQLSSLIFNVNWICGGCHSGYFLWSVHSCHFRKSCQLHKHRLFLIIWLKCKSKVKCSLKWNIEALALTSFYSASCFNCPYFRMCAASNSKPLSKLTLRLHAVVIWDKWNNRFGNNVHRQRIIQPRAQTLK